jgi:hypothetical protein
LFVQLEKMFDHPNEQISVRQALTIIERELKKRGDL